MFHIGVVMTTSTSLALSTVTVASAGLITSLSRSVMRGLCIVLMLALHCAILLVFPHAVIVSIRGVSVMMVT